MHSPSTEYEILVRDIHAALVASDCVENVNVSHNKKIKGRSGATHQVDVYWEFKVGGVKYKTCIECKHYNRRVEKSDVASFITTLDDIGNVTGIFATTAGYQSGAMLLAKERGVRLVTVNYLLKSVNITSDLVIPETSIFNVKYDENQARQRLIERNLTAFNCNLRWNLQTMFFDAEGNPKISLRQLDNQAMADGENVLEPEELYDQTEIGLIRVTEIHYRKTTSYQQSNQEIILNDTTRAILEDALENHSLYLNDDGSISQVET